MKSEVVPPSTHNKHNLNRIDIRTIGEGDAEEAGGRGEEWRGY